MARKFGAELLGTAILVFFGAGIAALVFGFRVFGASLAAGLIAIGIVFGLVYTAIAHVIGPVSGAHVNPAVTLGAFLTKRMSAAEMIYYWLAQLIGSLLGALVLWWVLSTSPYYSRSRIGLGANGYGANSVLHIGGGGAFLVEVVITAVFVLVALSLSRSGIAAAVTATGIGVALGLANLVGSAFTGASINPARSFGPAIIGGGSPLSQLWVFLIAPMVGGVLAGVAYHLLHPVPGGLRGMEQAFGRAGTGGGRQYAGNGHGAGEEHWAGEQHGAGEEHWAGEEHGADVGHGYGNGHGAGQEHGADVGHGYGNGHGADHGDGHGAEQGWRGPGGPAPARGDQPGYPQEPERPPAGSGWRSILRRF